MRVPIVSVVAVRTFRRIGIVAIALMTLLAHGMALAAGAALCFGRDGHARVEGAAEHQPSKVFSEKSGGVAALAAHGPCVDVMMSAREGEKHVTPPSPAVMAFTPVTADHSVAATGARADGQLLLPLVSFASTPLRI